ncbi:MAG: tRNA (adenosine(37)-N6)-threonylcarbamoyltransferase complex ATPase subunit type 1 TsaE [Clostridiales bacterium]|nr:tRNA (adenosine(37)-N6)-threonylcarbamoyltransferase complex ATPase subunit type 1 TsaE [Clostridiales bacterium]MBR6483695.1 tRNA (adenosine(37)-N6)-threonylcarbamoyltransferase complex ATPase subunit type 1 TsaE [Clostridiales bacterium]
MRKEFETTSPEQTEELGRKIGKRLKPGDVLSLDGDLGAGKTVITRGICAGMGLDPSDVQSPTFTIVNEYEGEVPLFHFDTYRLSGEDDFLASGLDEYFYRGGVCVIEWGSVIDGLLPEDTVRIGIFGSGSERKIVIESKEEIV